MIFMFYYKNSANCMLILHACRVLENATEHYAYSHVFCTTSRTPISQPLSRQSFVPRHANAWHYRCQGLNYICVRAQKLVCTICLDSNLWSILCFSLQVSFRIILLRLSAFKNSPKTNRNTKNNSDILFINNTFYDFNYSVII